MISQGTIHVRRTLDAAAYSAGGCGNFPQPVCGIDEAGRGPLAGDVVAAAVILPEEYDLPGLNDSKKLSPKRRDILYDFIREQAVAYAVASASVEEIGRLNILEATLLAMRRAADGLAVRPGLLLVDGKIARGFAVPARAVVRGDAEEPCIMAASILAKVSRDRAMAELDDLYPHYGFAKHKGYGTAAHIRALREFGPCPAHRLFFLRRLLDA
ncbi:MAG: ribonuclease HII [Oscillospiraceae bacterium]|jgi:ribonuclease HII|nr:ribonuclease HII [Oscillospiraceae bacterium]